MDTGRDQWITVTEYSPDMGPHMDKCSIIDNGSEYNSAGRGQTCMEFCLKLREKIKLNILHHWQKEIPHGLKLYK